MSKNVEINEKLQETKKVLKLICFQENVNTLYLNTP